MPTNPTALTGVAGSTAIVTGAAHGIGRAVAEAFGAAGLDVAVFDVDVDGARDTADVVRESGQTASVHQVDVADERDVRRGVSDAVDEHGTVDVLVNNAGVQIPGRVVEQDVGDWSRQFQVNVRGTFLCSKHVGSQMLEAGVDGRIVNVASQVGKLPPTELAAYSSTKFGVIGFTKVLAQEVAPDGVRVNAVCPGTIETRLLEQWAEANADGSTREFYETLRDEEIPLGRLGTTEDVANLVLFLVSDQSDFITGQAINVTGGETLV